LKEASLPKRLNPSSRFGHDTIRYYFNCAQKLTSVNLIYRTQPTTKKYKREKLKSKNGHAQTYRYPGIREVSPEKEKESYGGKDLQKRKVLSLK